MCGKILEDLRTDLNKNLKPLGYSFLWQNDALETRFCWATTRTAVLRENVETLRAVVSLVGFKEYLEIIERIADLILTTLHTTAYPIYIVGCAYIRNHIKQLKLYYTLYIFKSEEDIMGTINDELAKEAIMAILDELNLDEQRSKISKLMQAMQAKRQRVAFIGLNIEKRKKPGLKIYFEPLRENQQR